MEEIDVDGQVIRYRSCGAGPLVVLLHSSSSHSGQWAALSGVLETDFKVVAPDFHGYGRSDALKRDGRACFEHDRAVINALVGRYGGPAHLVGHSLGGTVALHAAVKSPDIVRSLCLIEPVQFSLLDLQGAAEAGEYHEISSSVMGSVHLGQTRQAARLFVEFWVGAGAFDAMEPHVQDYVEQTIHRVSDDWAGISRYAPLQLSRNDIASIPMPCQIIRGGATRRSAALICDILKDTIAGARLQQVPAATHMAAALNPAPFNEIITGFLTEQSLSPANEKEE